MPEIRVALVGVGNCASALVQGVYKYTDINNSPIGLVHPNLGGYTPKDIRFVAAFDVDERKVGKDLSEAIFAEPNTTPKFQEVPYIGVEVLRGPLLDGVGGPLAELVKVSDEPECNVVDVLRRSGAEVVVNLLPSGAMQASRWYAEASLKAGCAFINATPAPIVNDPHMAGQYRKMGLPLVGDDLMDQVGATVIHRALLDFLVRRGVRVLETYQLDVGGGAEALETLTRAKDAKREVKTAAVKSALPYAAPVVAGSTDYVKFLGNRRESYFWIRGLYFGETELSLDIKLRTVDGPNAGSVLLDAIRCAKIALDRGIGGPLVSISAYAFKNPPERAPLELAEKWLEAFLRGERDS
ncbi:inositol-3-phosphate synthase [Candidatus Bathyarchaeota archaeon]|nr:MAG: inositol-3-phosphate synthase [Candidatus Bathyarchaeota archaeon]